MEQKFNFYAFAHFYVQLSNRMSKRFVLSDEFWYTQKFITILDRETENEPYTVGVKIYDPTIYRKGARGLLDIMCKHKDYPDVLRWEYFLVGIEKDVNVDSGFCFSAEILLSQEFQEMIARLVGQKAPEGPEEKMFEWLKRKELERC